MLIEVKMILQHLNSKFWKLMTQIISYRQMEDVEGFRPQNGMYFKPKNNNYLIVLCQFEMTPLIKMK